MTNEELLNFIAKERMINSQYGTIEDDKAYGEVMDTLEKVEQLEKENRELLKKLHWCSNCGQVINWSE